MEEKSRQTVQRHMIFTYALFPSYLDRMQRYKTCAVFAIQYMRIVRIYRQVFDSKWNLYGMAHTKIFIFCRICCIELVYHAPHILFLIVWKWFHTIFFFCCANVAGAIRYILCFFSLHIINKRKYICSFEFVSWLNSVNFSIFSVFFCFYFHFITLFYLPCCLLPSH